MRARAKDRDAAHERIRKARSFKEFTDAEGAWNVIARGPVEAGAAFRAAHGPLVDEMFKAARAEGRREPYEAYAFDAFIELARRATGRHDDRRQPQPEPGAEPAKAKPKAKEQAEGDAGAASRDHQDRSHRAAARVGRG